jgi:NAD(P)-dependent dehydrogenase (short-subunit alcohol dehydrogenase family)
MNPKKVAIVTGGASGIGRSTAQLFAREGVNVMVSDVDDLGGRETVSLIKDAGGEASYHHADVSNPEHCRMLADATVQLFGRLDYACNNAGIGGEINPTADYSIEGWHKVLDINLNGVFYCMKYQIPHMLKSGGGSIVNMSSILGKVSFANSPAYVASKHGLNGLTKNAAVEYGTQGIRVNSIGPAFIKTPLLHALDDDTLNMLSALHPIGRIGMPEEVAELVVWLCSPKSSFVTGSYFPVDGGYLSR